MNSNVISELYDVVLNRKENFEEGSYTCYLFEKGIDKILKKCGEEASEVIIAAKNYDMLKKAEGEKTTQNISEEVAVAKGELEGEICDLMYHLLVLMAEEELELDGIFDTLEARRQKIGNLKKPYQGKK